MAVDSKMGLCYVERTKSKKILRAYLYEINTSPYVFRKS